MLCCLGGGAQPHETKEFSQLNSGKGDGRSSGPVPLTPAHSEPQPAYSQPTKDLATSSVKGRLSAAFARVSLGKADEPSGQINGTSNGTLISPRGAGVGGASDGGGLAFVKAMSAGGGSRNGGSSSITPLPAGAGTAAPQEALLSLLPVLTSLDGGWWDQIERAVVATAQHLSATHACVFFISGDATYASAVALAGPPAPPLTIGLPLALAVGPSSGPGGGGPGRVAGAGGGGGGGAPSSASAASAPVQVPVPALAKAASNGVTVAGGGGAGPSCAAAALVAQQLEKEPGRLLIFADAAPGLSSNGGGGGVGGALAAALSVGGGGKGGGGGGGGHRLPASAPPEWQALAAAVSGPGAGAGGCRHFAAVAIPSGHLPIGVLSMGAEGPGRPASWTPEALHSVAALLSAPVRVPQVDLACRALAEIASATTVHQLVRILLGAAAELIQTVTHIETQTRVAFVHQDVEAAAVFQSAATDTIGPAVRRRLSEVLLVDQTAQTTGGGGGGARSQAPAGRRSLNGGGDGATTTTAGTGQQPPSRSPSLVANATIAVEGARDSFADRPSLFARGGAPGEEVAVCRGLSLPLKHTLLVEALAQAAGLCIADCNAYVQDSKVYPRDLALTRGAPPPQSLALATAVHEGKPLLALYATYGSALPQALLQTVVQELGQLLRALTVSIAAKVTGPLAVEWGYLKHQLSDSVRNRSLRSLNSMISTAATNANAHAATTLNGAAAPDAGAAASTLNGMAGTAAGADHGDLFGLPGLESPARSLAASGPKPVGGGGGGGGGSGALPAAGGGGGTPGQSQYGETAGAAAAGGGAGEGSRGVSGSLGLQRGAVSGTAVGGTGAGGDGKGRDGRLSGRASFSLEPSNSPRGSCKLAPLIATLHERLKAAQALQMANCRAGARLQDLESIRILEQIGRGGYGVVYRGLYHGSEVAVKVIQESEVTADGPGGPAAGANDPNAANPLARMNSVALENKHLHDAIELVASVGMGGHPNLVQVLTFFTDACVLVGDTPIEALGRRLSGLDGVAELMRLTKLPSHRQPVAGMPGARAGAGGPVAGIDEDGVTEEEAAAAAAAAAAAVLPRTGVIVLVQEFCDAGTLKNAINQRAFFDRSTDVVDARGVRGHLQLNLRAVYSTLLEIALALRHMHGLHMVHCDLKPQNVLLKSSPRDPRGFTAKLSDFGLAKMMAHDENGELVIDEAVGSGTLTHMAPESLAGQTQLNASIDLYAFGILMWQMVCGTRLYQGLTTKQIIRGVVREHLRPTFPVWVPPEYRRLAERCWHPVPAERPTADAVVAELEAMVDMAHARAVAGGGGGGAAGSGWRTSAAAAAGGGGGGAGAGGQQRLMGANQPGRPQAGNTGAGAGPSMLVI
ncbi:hypothetical protein HYH02_014245 [Chlamydomonas schloesseri]|uniref:Protein kinase domain-containing protein n=1 Tax=Chlamydomonas schloesseri TaxID=2026947 RepID=A0A835VWV8_9CHLO|nr:hypothetical protein HYH02_014245 [Chlamydomonas schloesseri]|eukprot:KAG2428833.1 hypothetical protein HYH02_014245 [Chlamydomonas schloesseri]